MANTKVTSHVIANNAISASMIQSAAVTHDKLHATLDLSGKTLTLPATAIPSASTATTQAASDNSTKIATTAYVTTAIGNLVDSAPGALNTLNELAAALGDDASFSSTITTSLATKAPINNPTFTGSISHASDLTIDVAGDIVLDADGADVIFADGGTQYGFIANSSSDMVIKPMVQDKDLIIRGNDGGSTITALTLDMSEAGFATFNSGGSFGGTGALKIPAGTTGQRPTAATAQIRWNTTDGALEVYNGSAWTAVGTGSSNKVLDTFTGDGSNRTFTLSVTPANEDAIMVFIDGAYQEKSDYVLTNNSLVLDTAPLTNEKIAVHTTTASVHDGTSAVNQQFTGDGSTTDFTLSQDPKSENNTQVYINGVYQQKTDYTVTGTTLTFDTAPTNGDIIEVNMFTVATLGNTDTVTEGVSNQYFTDARARGAISVSGNAISYNSSTGVLTANFEEGPAFTSGGSFGGALGIGDTTPSSQLVVSDGVQNSTGISGGGTFIEIARTSGGDAGLIIQKNTSNWVMGIDNSDGNAGPLRFEYSAYGSQPSGLGSGTLALALAYNGNVGIGTTTPATELHVDGKILTAGGTASSPALQLNDVNSGLFAPGGNIVAFSTDGSERMRIDSSGNVGIGTGNSTPATKLHVYDPTGHSEVRAATSGSSGSKVPAFSVNNTNAEWSMAIVGAADNHLHFRENTASYASRMIIATGGNVGIGQSNPGQKLDVAGTIQSSVGFRVAGHPVVGYSSITGGYAANLGSTGTSTLNETHIYSGGNQRVVIDGSGKVLIGDIRESVQGAIHSITGVSKEVPVSIMARGSSSVDHNGVLNFFRTRATSGNYTATASGDRLGKIRFYGVNTSAVADIGAEILVEQNGTSSSTVPADMHFLTNETTRMTIKADGKVGLGNVPPYAQLDVYRGSTDPYTASSFLDYPTLGLKGPAGNGYYVGTRVTNSSGNYEWFYGTTQTSANEADFVFQGYDRGGGAYKELLRITDSGKLKLAQDAGLKMFSGYFGAGTSTGSFNIQGYGGGCMKITAAFNHYGFITGYGCFKQAICSNGPGHGGTSIQVNDLGGEITSSTGGSWTFHRNSGDQASYKVTKNAGTYAGGGYYYISFEGNMGIS